MVRQASITDSYQQRCVIVTCCNDVKETATGMRWIADLNSETVEV